MRTYIHTFLFLFSFYPSIAQKTSCENIDYPSPLLSDSIKNVFAQNLRFAEEKYQNDKSNDEHIIWYGRRLAYLGKYREAIGIYTNGIELHPANARFYRHRGHRYITLRCFDKAITDLKKAAELTNGQIDEVEADGIPNVKNIPVSTLQTNIYYHLGLAYYLEGDYRNALLAYEKCLSIVDNNDMMIATLNWLNLALRKLGKKMEADQRVKSLDPNIDLIENLDYLDILLMYRNNETKNLIERTTNQATLSNATLAYGLGAYYLNNGEKKKAREVFEKIVKGNQWSSFGYIAAETELARMK